MFKAAYSVLWIFSDLREPFMSDGEPNIHQTLTPRQHELEFGMKRKKPAGAKSNLEVGNFLTPWVIRERKHEKTTKEELCIVL